MYITAIHLVAGTSSEHIASVRWLDRADGKTGNSDRAGMVGYIDDQKGIVKVGSPSGPISVQMVHPTGRPAYIRTIANSQETDTFLQLARF